MHRESTHTHKHAGDAAGGLTLLGQSPTYSFLAAGKIPSLRATGATSGPPRGEADLARGCSGNSLSPPPPGLKLGWVLLNQVLPLVKAREKV